MTNNIILSQSSGSGFLIDTEYVRASIAQANFIAPESNIFFISDLGLDLSELQNCNYVNYGSFNSGARKLFSVLRHTQESSPYWYLLGIFGRIPVISEFVKEKLIKDFLYIESDVLLLQPPNDFLKIDSINLCIKQDLSLMNMGAMYFNESQKYNDFSEFIQSNTDLLHGNATEMYLMKLYFDSINIDRHNLCDISKNLDKFDFSISDDEGSFEMSEYQRYGRTYKEITKIGESFYGVSNGAQIKLNGIHLHAEFKFDWLKYSSFLNSLSHRRFMRLPDSWVVTEEEMYARSLVYSDSEALLAAWIKVNDLFQGYGKAKYEVLKILSAKGRFDEFLILYNGMTKLEFYDNEHALFFVKFYCFPNGKYHDAIELLDQYRFSSLEHARYYLHCVLYIGVYSEKIIDDRKVYESLFAHQPGFYCVFLRVIFKYSLMNQQDLMEFLQSIAQIFPDHKEINSLFEEFSLTEL